MPLAVTPPDHAADAFEGSTLHSRSPLAGLDVKTLRQLANGTRQQKQIAQRLQLLEVPCLARLLSLLAC
jgi:hypothetical protein